MAQQAVQLTTWRAVADALFGSFIEFLRRQQNSGFHSDGAACIDRQRGSRHARVIWDIGDRVHIVLAESKIERFQLSTDSLYSFLRRLAPLRPAVFQEPFCTFRRIGSL